MSNTKTSKIKEKYKDLKEAIKFNWKVMEAYSKEIEGTTPKTFNASKEMINNIVISNLCLYGGIPIAILSGMVVGGTEGIILTIILIPTIIIIGLLYDKKSKVQYAHINPGEV